MTLAGLQLGLTSCNVINPAEDIPTYIQVNSITEYTNPEIQGSSSSNFSDVWVTVDNQFLNGYQLGRKIPLLYNGRHELTLRAGILLNGIEGTRVPFAVLQPFDTVIDFQPGVVHVITPRVTYSPGAHIPLNEDFDHSSFFFTASSTSTPLMIDNNSFENKGAIAVLDPAHTDFECTTIDSFDLPGGTTPTYIEINYKTTTEFLVGVKANTDLGPLDFPLLHIRKSDNWNKIYVNLTSIASQAEHASDWRIYLNSSLEDGHATDTLRFDNIKLVY